MQTYSIKDIKDNYYKAFYDFYFTSFPIHEQRNEQQQIYAFGQEAYHLDCCILDDKVAGFIAYWDFNDLIYIEHLAVNPEMRGKNIGTGMLSEFIKKDKPVILEIDPLVDEVSRKRLQFYQRLGFVMNNYVHHHPAYDKQYPPHELIVLSVPITLTQPQYNSFYKNLCEVVMLSDK